MTEQQQKLYDKLLKKVNEYCLGAAAEDVITAIDALVESYETNISAYQMFYNGFTYYFNGEKITLTDFLNRIKALEIIKERLEPYVEKYRELGYVLECDMISIGIPQEEYELLKEVLNESTN